MTSLLQDSLASLFYTQVDRPYVELDQRIHRTPTHTYINRIVRILSLQPSFKQMISTLEEQCCKLVCAARCRVLLIRPNGPGHKKMYNEGLAGFVQQSQKILPIENPSAVRSPSFDRLASRV